MRVYSFFRAPRRRTVAVGAGTAGRTSVLGTGGLSAWCGTQARPPVAQERTPGKADDRPIDTPRVETHDPVTPLTFSLALQSLCRFSGAAEMQGLRL